MSREQIDAVIRGQGYTPQFKPHKKGMEVYASFAYLGKLSVIMQMSEEALIALIDAKFRREEASDE